MGFAIRIPDEPYVWLQKIYVGEGQSIAPGAEIADIMLPDGVVQTIVSECWGIVAHVEDDLGDCVNDNDSENTSVRRKSNGGDGRNFTLFSKGDIICHIAKRDGVGNRDGKLHPRTAPALRRMRMGF